MVLPRRQRLKQSDRTALWVNKNLADAIRVIAATYGLTMHEATYHIIRIGVKAIMDYEELQTRKEKQHPRPPRGSDYWRNWFLRHANDPTSAGQHPGQENKGSLPSQGTEQTEGTGNP